MKQHVPVYAPRVGDQVRIVGRSEIYTVTHTDDLALATLESRQGKRFRAGWRALELVARAAA